MENLYCREIIAPLQGGILCKILVSGMGILVVDLLDSLLTIIPPTDMILMCIMAQLLNLPVLNQPVLLWDLCLPKVFSLILDNQFMLQSYAHLYGSKPQCTYFWVDMAWMLLLDCKLNAICCANLPNATPWYFSPSLLPMYFFPYVSGTQSGGWDMQTQVDK